jgi:hypothetical protein
MRKAKSRHVLRKAEPGETALEKPTGVAEDAQSRVRPADQSTQPTKWNHTNTNTGVNVMKLIT